MPCVAQRHDLFMSHLLLLLLSASSAHCAAVRALRRDPSGSPLTPHVGCCLVVFVSRLFFFFFATLFSVNTSCVFSSLTSRPVAGVFSRLAPQIPRVSSSPAADCALFFPSSNLNNNERGNAVCVFPVFGLARVSCGPDVLRPAPRSDRNIPAVELMEWRLNGNNFFYLFFHHKRPVSEPWSTSRRVTFTHNNELINAAWRSISWVLGVSVLLLFCHPRVWCTCQPRLDS